jgi:hypothetical protein
MGKKFSSKASKMTGMIRERRWYFFPALMVWMRRCVLLSPKIIFGLFLKTSINVPLKGLGITLYRERPWSLVRLIKMLPAFL